MPRPWTIVVAAWPALLEGRKYELDVAGVEKPSASDGLLVTLVHRQGGQCGRKHEIHLDPCRPDGLTAEFFRACGQEVKTDARLRPKDCLRRTIVATFRVKPNGEAEPINFASITKEVSHDHAAT